jgi:pimeloyl-ACP methyl ester carboxylesterase
MVRACYICRRMLRSSNPRLAIEYAWLLITLLMFTGCADRIVLYPTAHPIDPKGARQVVVPFRSGQLELFVARSPGCASSEPAAFDLELLGNGARAELVAAPIAKHWGGRPVEVWAMNYPGYGQSSGPAKLDAIPPSALAAYDAVARVANGRPILLGSHSLGTAVALYVARNRSVAGLVLLNPPPLRQLILQHYGWWNLWLGALPVANGIPSELDSLSNAPEVTAPAIFLSAANDAIVPPRFHRMVYDSYVGPKRLVVLPDEDHNTLPDPQTVEEYKAGLDWLWATAK